MCNKERDICLNESEKVVDKEEILNELEEMKEAEEEAKLLLESSKKRLKKLKMISFITDYTFVFGTIFLIIKFGTHNSIMNFLYIAYLLSLAFIHYRKNQFLKELEVNIEDIKSIQKEIEDEKERLYAILNNIL